MVSVAVAVTFGDVGTSALVDFAWSVANTTGVQGTDAVVDIITNAIGIGVSRAVSTAYSKGVKLVAVAVTVSCEDVSAAALVNLARPVADTAGIEGADTVVDIVTDAIGIGIGCAGPAADAEGVKLVAVAVTVAFGDIGTAALVNLTIPVANSTGVLGADTVVDVVTDAISIGIRLAGATADIQCIQDIPVAVAF